MVQTLFHLTSHVVRNAVVIGEISDASHLSLELRIWIFELFRMKNLINTSSVIRFLCQPGFLDGFTKISMQETEDNSDFRSWCNSSEYNTKFLLPLVLTFGVNRRLAENITDLSLRISEDCVVSAGRQPNKCPHVEHIANLLSLCGNLKRLQLVSYLNSDVYKTCSNYSLDFSEIAVSAPVLEHLSLINAGSSFWLRSLPRRLFMLLKSLELRNMRYDVDTLSAVLSCCQETLTSLHVVDNSNFSIASAIQIRLPKLSNFSFDKYYQFPTIFEDILQRYPNVTVAELKFVIGTISAAELVALRQLRNRLQLYLTIRERVSNFGDLVEIAGESIFGLDFAKSSLTSTDYDRILSKCTNLRVLRGYFASAESTAFLQKLFSDKGKAATLTEISITCWSLEAVFTPLFANCCSLERLDLTSSGHADLDKHLQLWVENGARPSVIWLCGDIIVHRDGIYAAAKASGHILKEMFVTMDCAEAESCEYQPVLSDCCPFVKVFKLAIPGSNVLNVVKLSNKLEQLCFKSLIVALSEEIRGDLRTLSYITYTMEKLSDAL